MMISTPERKHVVSLMFVGSLLLLTGCLNKKEESCSQENNSTSMVDRGEVLLSIDGKPVLFSDDFEDQKAMAQQSNQQLNMILQMMPEAEYKMLFKSIEAGHLMKAWVVREGIDQKPDLVKQRQQYHDAIDLQLYMKYYEDAHPIEVTDHEAQNFYKARRDQIPGLMLAPAGVDIVYVAFDNKAKAEAFLAKVKDGSEKHFKAAAKEASVKVESMNINRDSDVSEALKNVVLGIEKFPAKELVKVDDNAYWVVGMVKKQEAQYRSFEEKQIKDGITKMCRDEKREAELTKQIEKLAQEFNVVENTEYFDKKRQNQAKAVQKAEELVRQAQAHDADVAELQDKI